MLPKTADYALRATVWLAQRPDVPQSAEELARRTRVPRRYLHKVLQDLVKAELVWSQPGPGGGYALSRAPAEISMLDVVNAVGSIERVRECPLGLEGHTTLCPLHQELDNAFAAMEQAFARVTLADVLRQSHPIAPLCAT